MLNLNNLPKSKAVKGRKKRLGRGNSSGKGTYSGRGLKGQRARSGGKSGLSSRSIKGYLLRIPKSRGFKSLYPAMAVVNLGELNQAFSDSDKINPRTMLKAGLIKDVRAGVKVLSKGKLNKKLTIEAQAFSAKAQEKIKTAGGQAVVIAKEKEVAGDKKTGQKAEK